MFSVFEIFNICGKAKRYFSDKVHSIISREYFKDITDSTSEKVVKLATNEEYAQTEHIKRLLEERQKKIDDELRPTEEIRKAKENFRLRMYKATARKREKKHDKDHDLDRSR